MIEVFGDVDVHHPTQSFGIMKAVRRQMSTPERNCIGGPEQNCITTGLALR